MSQSTALDNGEVPSGMPPVNYLNADRGVWSWLTTIDHKRIGIMYLVSVLLAFLAGWIVPMRDARKVWRTSAWPVVSSTSSGSSMPCIAARSSSIAR